MAGDVKQTGLDQATPGIMYVPSGQVPDRMTLMGNGLLGMSWIVRTKSAQVDVATSARLIFMGNAHTPLLSVEPLDQVISASVAQQRFSMVLLATFGLISLVLGAAGLYGVLSFTVARQTKEIGLRMAVGAERGDIIRMVLGDAGKLILIGLVIGVISFFTGWSASAAGPGLWHRPARPAHTGVHVRLCCCLPGYSRPGGRQDAPPLRNRWKPCGPNELLSRHLLRIRQ